LEIDESASGISICKSVLESRKAGDDALHTLQQHTKKQSNIERFSNPCLIPILAK
jgi:hypothetical protein